MSLLQRIGAVPVRRFSNGKPAAGIAIYYLGAQEQIGMTEKGKLMLHSRELSSKTQTDCRRRYRRYYRNFAVEI